MYVLLTILVDPEMWHSGCPLDAIGWPLEFQNLGPRTHWPVVTDTNHKTILTDTTPCSVTCAYLVGAMGIVAGIVAGMCRCEFPLKNALLLMTQHVHSLCILSVKGHTDVLTHILKPPSAHADQMVSDFARIWCLKFARFMFLRHCWMTLSGAACVCSPGCSWPHKNCLSESICFRCFRHHCQSPSSLEVLGLSKHEQTRITYGSL